MLKTMIFSCTNGKKSLYGLVYLRFELNMKRGVILLFCALVTFSCKKDKKNDPPASDPEPVKTGTVNLNIFTIDSLGNREADPSNVAVSLYQTGFSAITGANGNVSFSQVPYGTVLPVLQKQWYEGPPMRLELSSAAVWDTIPCAKYSAYKLQNLSGFIFSPDSIPLSFQLDRPVPAGKRCKIAIVFAGKPVDANNYSTVDTISVNTQTVQKRNIAFLPNLRALLQNMKKDTTLYFSAIPVSYGIYHSNVFNKNVLLGENPFLADNLIFNKYW